MLICWFCFCQCNAWHLCIPTSWKVYWHVCMPNKSTVHIRIQNQNWLILYQQAFHLCCLPCWRSHAADSFKLFSRPRCILVTGSLNCLFMYFFCASEMCGSVYTYTCIFFLLFNTIFVKGELKNWNYTQHHLLTIRRIIQICYKYIGNLYM